MAAEEGRIKLLDAIQGDHYQAIQKSAKVLDHHKLELSRYDVLLASEDEDDYVILSEIDKKATARKSFGVKVGAKTELDSKELARLASKSPELTELAKLHGTSLRAIQAANVVFTSRSPNSDLAQYKIEVVKDGGSIVVIFADKDREEGARGNIPGRPGMEVTLDSHDLHVIRSNFIR